MPFLSSNKTAFLPSVAMILTPLKSLGKTISDLVSDSNISSIVSGITTLNKSGLFSNILDISE